MMLMGWTLKQWAIVIGQLEVEPKTIDEAIDIRYKWESENKPYPRESLMIHLPVDPRPINYPASCALFREAKKEIYLN